MIQDAGVVDSGGTPKTCWRCGARFECGSRDGAVQCWCEDLPPIQPTTAGADCLCPACLTTEVSLQNRKADRSSSAMVEGVDYYMEGAAVVFTAGYHLRRGSCCGSGCRHCPYSG